MLADGRTLSTGSLRWIYQVEDLREVFRPSHDFHDMGNLVIISRDGSRSVSDRFEVFDWKTKRRSQLRLREWGTTRLALSPTGNTLAAVGRDQSGRATLLRLWDVDARRERAVLRGPADTLLFTPDGRALISLNGAGGETEAQLWDPVTGQERFRFRLRRDREAVAALAPDGRTLAFVTGKADPRKESWPDVDVSLWGLGADRPPLVLRGHGPERHRAHAIGFAPSGRSLFVSEQEGPVSLWNTATGEKKGDVIEDRSWRRFAVSAGGRTVAVTDASKERASVVHVLDAETGKELRRYARQRGEINGLALSPDGRTLALLQVTSLRSLELTLWQEDAKRPSAKTTIPVADSCGEATLVFAPDGRHLGVVFKESNLFEVATGRRIRTFEPGRACLVPGPKAASLFPEGAERREVARQPLVDIRKAVRTQLGNEGTGTVRVLAEAVSPDGRRLATLLSGHPDPTLALWDLDSGKLLRRVAVSLTAQAGSWAQFSADGSTLLAWDRQGVCVVDFATGRERLVLRGVQPVNESLSVPVLAPDGSMLAAGGFEGVRVWLVPRCGRPVAPSRSGGRAAVWPGPGGAP